MLKLKPGAKKAIAIGGLCSVAYLAVYVAKNILSAATPQITASGGIMVVMATLCLIVFTAVERKGLVRYNQFKSKEKGEQLIKTNMEGQ